MRSTSSARIFFACAVSALILVTTLLGGATVRADESNVTRATLPNGLRIVIVRDPLAPVVSTTVNYLAGSDETPAGFPGTAHAQEHMMFRDSKGLSAAQLADINAAMGGDLNADTQNTVTQYYYTVPAKDLGIALHVEATRMRGVLDSQAQWAQERGAIEQEVSRDLSNPFYRFFSTALSHVYAGTPYEHDALGTRPSFDKTTGASLKRFYDAWYHPNNAILVITGDVDPAAALNQVRQLFGGIPKAALPAHPAVKLHALKAETMKLDTDFPVPLAVIVYRMPGFESPDWAAGQVLTAVLGSQRGDLYGLSASGKAIATGFFSVSNLPKAGAALAFGAPLNGDANAMAAAVKSVLADYVKNGVPADLVEASKRRLVSQAEFNRNSIFGLGTAWSQAVAVEGRSSPDDDIAAFQRVSKADVDAAAKRYLNNETATVGILTPRQSGKATAEKGFGGAESFAPKETKAVALPSWARNVISSVSVPPSSLSPVETTLPNGVRLIVQRESISHTVTVVGRVKSNPKLQEPAGKEGVADVLGGLFSYGTQSRDRLTFQKALDDISAQESAGSDFSLQVLSPNFERGVELLADNELHPALPDAAFATVKAQTAQGLAGTLTSPGYLTERALLAALYPKDDPLQREATPATVNGLTPADAKAYFSTTFRPDLTTIVVIGDVTPEQAQASISKWFGGWTASGSKPQTELPAAPLNAPAAATVPNAARLQDDVTLEETLGITRDNPDYYALQVGNHVLGGGFYATRLAHDLREVAGLVYTVANRFHVGKTRSTYQVTFGSDPPKVSQARALIVRDLKAMQTSTVTPNELQLAKALLLQEIPLNESSEDDIASQLLDNAIAGLALNESELAAQRYVTVTADQVKAAFAKWVRPDSFVQVVQGPPPS
ncbi:MAG: insulinase family protein [Candidatus Eremiobacteraeota bacterium]|nr:insulinase family protein [Candidatus Eremiobacteraeota bacterium]